MDNSIKKKNLITSFPTTQAKKLIYSRGKALSPPQGFLEPSPLLDQRMLPLIPLACYLQSSSTLHGYDHQCTAQPVKQKGSKIDLTYKQSNDLLLDR